MQIRMVITNRRKRFLKEGRYGKYLHTEETCGTIFSPTGDADEFARLDLSNQREPANSSAENNVFDLCDTSDEPEKSKSYIKKK